MRLLLTSLVNTRRGITTTTNRIETGGHGFIHLPNHQCDARGRDMALFYSPLFTYSSLVRPFIIHARKQAGTYPFPRCRRVGIKPLSMTLEGNAVH
jgi:hypothetical protein